MSSEKDFHLLKFIIIIITTIIEHRSDTTLAVERALRYQVTN